MPSIEETLASDTLRLIDRGKVKPVASVAGVSSGGSLVRIAPPGGGVKLVQASYESGEPYDVAEAEYKFLKIRVISITPTELVYAIRHQISRVPLPADAERGTVSVSMAVDTSEIRGGGWTEADREIIRNQAVALFFGRFLASRTDLAVAEDIEAPPGTPANPTRTGGGAAGGL